MAIAVTNVLSNFSDSDGTAFVTAAFTPAADTLYLLSVSSARGAGAGTPTAAGAGVTWTQVGSTALFNSNQRGLTVFYALGAGSNGSVTITYADSQTAASWVVDAVTGCATTGTNGADAFAQAVTAAANADSNLDLTLAAFDDATNNVAYGVFSNQGVSTTITPGAGFAELAEAASATPTTKVETQWDTGEATTVTATASSGTPDWGGFAFELAIDPGDVVATGFAPRTFRHSPLRGLAG